MNRHSSRAAIGARPIRVGAYAPSPVYYRSGLYRRLAADPRFEFSAIFSSSAGVRPGDLGYGEPVAFDADALEGFESTFLRRAARTETDGSFTSLLDPDLAALLVRRRFDVLWMHGYYSASHLLAATTQIALRGKLLIREEQTLLDWRPAWKRALKQILLRTLLFRSFGLYIGTRNREWFEHYGLPASRSFHVPFCVDNDYFAGEASRLRGAKQNLRAAFGISPDAGPVILSVSRLAASKQTGMLIEAFAGVRATRRCVLLLVGAGPMEPELHRQIELREVPDVVFAGFMNQSEIARAYAASDVFVLPSAWSETWGLAVNEAMNFGLPIVVSDKVGCAADLVRPGENGFVVAHDRPSELADVLMKLVGDDRLRESLGEQSRRRIRSWTYESALVGLLSAIRESVGEARWAEAESYGRHSGSPPILDGNLLAPR